MRKGSDRWVVRRSDRTRTRGWRRRGVEGVAGGGEGGGVMTARGETEKKNDFAKFPADAFECARRRRLASRFFAYAVLYNIVNNIKLEISDDGTDSSGRRVSQGRKRRTVISM